jgi:hypothetical protein
MTTGRKPISLRDWLKYCWRNRVALEYRDILKAARLWRSIHGMSCPVFRVKYQNYVLPYKFANYDAALRWALENYKGSFRGWTIKREQK